MNVNKSPLFTGAGEFRGFQKGALISNYWGHLIRVNDILSSYGAMQHVDVPTHRLGGSLDVVITGDDCTPTCVHVDDPGLSDHWLVRWLFNLRL